MVTGGVVSRRAGRLSGRASDPARVVVLPQKDRNWFSAAKGLPFRGGEVACMDCTRVWGWASTR